MTIGEFQVRRTYSGYTRGGYQADYVASPDQSWISSDFGIPLPRPCEVVIERLSRDECETFADPLDVAFKGGPDNPVIEGTTLSWWHLSKLDGIAEQVREDCLQMVNELDVPPDRIDATMYDQLCTSDIFSDTFSRGYIARLCQQRHLVLDESVLVPNARYHTGLNELINSYKDLLQIQEVEFRIHGSTFYPCEVMHSILICPSEDDLARNPCLFPNGLEHRLKTNYPLMEVGPFTSYEERRNQEERAATVDERVLVERDLSGRYRLIWNPWCTRSVTLNSLQI